MQLPPWGCRRGKTPVQLWLEKTGRVQREDISGKEYVHFGNVLEDVVAQEYARRNHRKVQRRREPYVQDFMVANVDRLIVNHDAILEAKTADKWSAGKWDEGPPDHYRIQVHHQMITSGKREAVLAVLIGGNEYRDYEINWNDGVAEGLYANERKFWECVENDTPPPPQTAEDVVRLYPRDDGESIVATTAMIELWNELRPINAEHSRLTKLKKEKSDEMRLQIGQHAEIVLDETGHVITTYKTSKGSEKTNHQAIIGELRSEAQAAVRNGWPNYSTCSKRNTPEPYPAAAGC